jgi:hypothetical protein
MKTLIDSQKLQILLDKFKGTKGEYQDIVSTLSSPMPDTDTDSYEIAKIFNTPTHQVVMLKTFKEEAKEEQRFDEEGYPEEDEEGDYIYDVSYSTSYQIKQIMYHNGVQVSRSFGYNEEADRNEFWGKVGQQQAQEFVDATVKFIDEQSTEGPNDLLD